MTWEYSSAVQVVAVPTIGDADTGEVATNVATSSSPFAPAVGDAVIAIPLEALPTDCSLTGAWVSAANVVTTAYSAQDGAVTGANVNFRFKFFDVS